MTMAGGLGRGQPIETLYVELDSRIANIEGKIGTAMRGAERAAQQGETRISNIMRSGSIRMTTFGQNAATAGTLFGVALSTMGAAIGAFGMKATMMAGSMEATERGMAAMLGSAEKAKAFVKEMQDFAATTPFEFTGLVSASQQFLAFGVAAKDLIPMMTIMGDALAQVGRGAESIPRVTLAFTQMLSTGRLNAQDMMQLANAGIRAWPLLAEAMGVSISEVRKMAEKGMISGAKAVELLLEGMKKTSAGAMANLQGGINQSLSNLKDVTDQTMIAVGMTISKAFDVPGTVVKLVENLDVLRKSAEKFAEAVEEGGVEGAFKETFGEDVLNNIGLIAGAIVGILAPAIFALSKAAGGLLLSIAPFAAAGVAIVLLGQQMGIWEKVFNTLNDVVTSFLPQLRSASDYLQGIASKVGPGGALTQIDSGPFKDLVVAIGDVIPKLQEAAKGFGELADAAGEAYKVIRENEEAQVALLAGGSLVAGGVGTKAVISSAPKLIDTVKKIAKEVALAVVVIGNLGFIFKEVAATMAKGGFTALLGASATAAIGFTLALGGVAAILTAFAFNIGGFRDSLIRLHAMLQDFLMTPMRLAAGAAATLLDGIAAVSAPEQAERLRNLATSIRESMQQSREELYKTASALIEVQETTSKEFKAKIGRDLTEAEKLVAAWQHSVEQIERANNELVVDLEEVGDGIIRVGDEIEENVSETADLLEGKYKGVSKGFASFISDLTERLTSGLVSQGEAALAIAAKIVEKMGLAARAVNSSWNQTLRVMGRVIAGTRTVAGQVPGRVELEAYLAEKFPKGLDTEINVEGVVTTLRESLVGPPGKITIPGADTEEPDKDKKGKEGAAGKSAAEEAEEEAKRLREELLKTIDVLGKNLTAAASLAFGRLQLESGKATDAVAALRSGMEALGGEDPGSAMSLIQDSVESLRTHFSSLSEEEQAHAAVTLESIDAFMAEAVALGDDTEAVQKLLSSMTPLISEAGRLASTLDQKIAQAAQKAEDKLNSLANAIAGGISQAINDAIVGGFKVGDAVNQAIDAATRGEWIKDMQERLQKLIAAGLKAGHTMQEIISSAGVQEIAHELERVAVAQEWDRVKAAYKQIGKNIGEATLEGAKERLGMLARDIEAKLDEARRAAESNVANWMTKLGLDNQGFDIKVFADAVWRQQFGYTRDEAIAAIRENERLHRQTESNARKHQERMANIARMPSELMQALEDRVREAVFYGRDVVEVVKSFIERQAGRLAGGEGRGAEGKAIRSALVQFMMGLGLTQGSLESFFGMGPLQAIASASKKFSSPGGGFGPPGTPAFGGVRAVPVSVLHVGGVVPGPVGVPQAAMVLGGERFLTGNQNDQIIGLLRQIASASRAGHNIILDGEKVGNNMSGRLARMSSTPARMGAGI